MTVFFERTQIPRIVVTIRNSRKPIDRLKPISLPWAQGFDAGFQARSPCAMRYLTFATIV